MFTHFLKCLRCFRGSSQTSLVESQDFQPDNCVCGGKKEIASTTEYIPPELPNEAYVSGTEAFL